MVVAYSWKLNGDVLFTEGASPLEVIEEHEYPVMACTLGDLQLIQKRWPADLCEAAASGEWEEACEAQSSGDLRKASKHFQWAAAYVERFDDQGAVAFSADCYDHAAKCELSLGLPVLAVNLLRQVVSLNTRAAAPLDQHVALLSRAVAEDEAALLRLQKLVGTPQTVASQVTAALNYLLFRPTPKRLRIARTILNSLSREDPERLLLDACCAAAEGDLSAAIAAIDSMDSVTADASRLRDEWHAISEGDGLHVGRPVSSQLSPLRFAELLLEKDILNEKEAEAFYKLYEIKDEATRPSSRSLTNVSSASTYSSLAHTLAERIKQKRA